MPNFKFQISKVKKQRGLIVIPAFNEERVIGGLLRTLKVFGKRYNLDLVVINDGSSDNTISVVKKNKIKILSHPINRGLGAALGTGFEYARDKDYDFLVTLDGDGQHDPKELPHLIKPVIQNQADFVVGTRIYKQSFSASKQNLRPNGLKKGMPLSRRVLTFLASLFTYFITGVWTTDSQSGFRVFSKNAIQKIEVEVDRMEISTDFFRQAWENKLVIQEVPIRPIYTKYSIDKGQNVLNSFNIVGKLALQRMIK